MNINGSIADESKATVSVFDHGFLYGDAIYETLRTYRGCPFLLPKHFARLTEAADTLGIAVPWSLEALSGEIRRTLGASVAPPEWLVRIIVTRGVGDLSPDPVSCKAPTGIIIVIPFTEHPPEFYERGVAIAISPHRRDPLIASIKTGNLIHQVLGARDARTHGVAEIIFLSPEGHISDGTRSNIFLVRAGKLLTPSDDSGIVRGITRGMVIQVAESLGIEVLTDRFRPDIVPDCSEAFLTSTTRGIMPVTRIDGRMVGNGRAGEVTGKLRMAYLEAVRNRVAEGTRE